ncbi:MAG: HEAT repeat domain-containing protein [Myxococcaceae bacterium]|nr:HEAT repeat domain-containing protein [Myxococcaceae bacterium]MBH2006728.1 HEAT repeat domain-containing protein [Myxococcaceae bacterium]
MTNSRHINPAFSLAKTITLAFFLIALILAGSCHRSSNAHDLPELIQQLQSADSHKARKALVILTRLGDPKALDAVIAYSEGKSPALRIQAILAARQFKSPRALPWLFVLANGHPDENVRHAAQEALSCLERQDGA